MNREQLLHESVLDKFLRYVQVDSPADPDSDTVPSSPEQWQMIDLLRTELETLGLHGVAVSAHGIVTATLPGRVQGAPAVGFIAHFDTYPGTPGRGIKPIVHRQYDGGEIRLPGGAVLSPAELPMLTAAVGHDIVTSDGSTLLGADDKAGVAEIMAAVCRLLRDPGLAHGDVKVAFTPDEEIGTGVLHFDVPAFGAVAAYTVDGGTPGQLNGETFYAENIKVNIYGRQAHTGTAKGNMINAVQLAAAFTAAIPAHLRPETTSGREGFIHVNDIAGDVERVELYCLLRDFERDGLRAKRELIEHMLRQLELQHPGARTEIAVTGGYPNMRDGLSAEPRALALARQAYRDCGLEPDEQPVRGGTDGSQLTAMGLPTPNIFTGGNNAHSRAEWASVQWMEQAVDVIVRLAVLWGQESA